MPNDTRERPIIFSGEMVRALLSGTKTQTRRVIKPQPEHIEWFEHQHGWCAHFTASGYALVQCPFGVHGDRLWVREAWRYADWTDDGMPYVAYRADAAVVLHENAEDQSDVWAKLSDPDNYAIDGKAADRRWRPSIHMPRWASRLTLEVTDVRVQRLQDISDGDAWAEGILGDSYMARDNFRQLWDSLNAKRGHGWDTNPWVWALTFKVFTQAEG